jgi:hypothetical protein
MLLSNLIEVEVEVSELSATCVIMFIEFYNHRLYYNIYIGIYRFIFVDYSMFVYVNNVSVLYKYYEK